MGSHKQTPKMRVFIGPQEISNICALLAAGLREKGFRVTAVADAESSYYGGSAYDKVYHFDGRGRAARISMYCWHFLRNCSSHDAFVFLFGKSLLPFNLDLPILRFLGKTTVMWFLGSEIRDPQSVRAAAAKMGIEYDVAELDELPGDREERLKLVHRVEKNVDHVICGPSNAQLLTRPYFGESLRSRVFLPLDVKNIRYSAAANDPPVIVHAPSSRAAKGTTHVLAVVDRLKQEGRSFNFRLLTNVSNSVVRETLSEADIAVDQLFAAGPGMFALEAMAAGCAVLGGNIPAFSGYPEELPIVHTDRTNLYQNIQSLLDSPQRRQELGRMGRAYVEKYHDCGIVAGMVADVLTGAKALRQPSER